MASIESRIDAFIASNELDKEIKDPLCALITEAMGDLFKHVFNQPVPNEGTETGKAKKVLKADKVEDPTTCESQEELRNCTTGVLNQFCKDNGLKVGGNKKEIMDRVWRHMQGESSDEDKSTRNKSKAAKKVPEKHVCAGNNIAGVPCGSSGTEEFDGCYFCWRHISDAQKFIDAKKPKAAASANAPESVAKSKAKAPKASSAPSKKSKKKDEPKEELVTEDDDAEEQETDEDA
jgi:hypothetical protein